MFSLIPSHRQENLLASLDMLLQNEYESSANPFTSPIVVVQNQGMKHYVNLGLARRRGLSMNVQFPLISRCIFDLCRLVLGPEQVPAESPFKREFVTWQLYGLLMQDEVIEHPQMQSANTYLSKRNFDERAVFELCRVTADVFEQYVQYRDDWLEQWEAGHNIEHLPADLHNWQMYLWQRLASENGLHPTALMNLAMSQLDNPVQPLPRRIHLFAVASMTPKQLAFIQALAQHIDIIFYHLNPCMDYWGDLLTEKAIQQNYMNTCMRHYIDDFAEGQSPHPLLGNLGQQGRELFNQLMKMDIDFTAEFLAQEAAVAYAHDATTLLSHVQQSILHLSLDNKKTLPADHSLTVHSCYSQIREIQQCHDFLLDLMQNDPDIKPHDVIVLCPSVEDYAPYVNGVFRTPYEAHIDEPRLVCSIADRAPLDSEPSVHIFLTLLTLPDSRFEVSVLLDYLSLASVKAQYQFTDSDIETLKEWIELANIRWGLSGPDKAAQLDMANSDEVHMYSWGWGIARLFRGAIADPDNCPNNESWLTVVEGLNLTLLGKLNIFFARLIELQKQINQPRNASQWSQYLYEHVLPMISANPTDKEYQVIKRGIDNLAHNIASSSVDALVSLKVIAQDLSDYFSTPDPLNQFNTGQVTFSSMVPMRSVPFKVVCMLGLNDGVFPRISQKVSIDLMQCDQKRQGDRSRKLEDRYLFLEALTSAREAFYLSYVGRSHTNNQALSPSLVVKELTDFVQFQYNTNITTLHPLQPFSEHLFDASTEEQSFAKSWLNTLQKAPRAMDFSSVSFVSLPTLTAQEVRTCFNSPLAFFAKQRLHMKFDNYLENYGDSEPFHLSSLTNYDLEQLHLAHVIDDREAQFTRQFQDYINRGDINPALLNSQVTQKFNQGINSSALHAYRHLHKVDNALHYTLAVTHRGSAADVDNSDDGGKGSVCNVELYGVCQYVDDNQKRYYFARNISRTALNTVMGLYNHCIEILQNKVLLDAAFISYEINYCKTTFQDKYDIRVTEFTAAEISIDEVNNWLMSLYHLVDSMSKWPSVFTYEVVARSVKVVGEHQLAISESSEAQLHQALTDVIDNVFQQLNKPDKLTREMQFFYSDNFVPSDQPLDALIAFASEPLSQQFL